MQVFIRGVGPTRLEQSEFVARGGQGSVYARGDVAFKIYDDPRGALSSSKSTGTSVAAAFRIFDVPAGRCPVKLWCARDGQDRLFPLDRTGEIRGAVLSNFLICYTHTRSRR